MLRPRLVLIGGPPGVGKSEVASRLYAMLDECAWLDGDDVWRVHPFRVDAERVALAERNIVAVLRNYLSRGCAHVILTWVFHRQEIVERILCGLEGVPFGASVFTLTCDEATLASRWQASHPGKVDMEVPLQRLRECAAVESTHVDTTGLTVDEVVGSIFATLTAGEAAARTAEPSN